MFSYLSLLWGGKPNPPSLLSCSWCHFLTAQACSWGAASRLHTLSPSIIRPTAASLGASPAANKLESMENVQVRTVPSGTFFPCLVSTARPACKVNRGGFYIMFCSEGWTTGLDDMRRRWSVCLFLYTYVFFTVLLCLYRYSYMRHRKEQMLRC